MIRVRRLAVTGTSMSPSFQEGDRLVAVWPWPIRTGQVVALRDPRDGRLLVKRVAGLRNGLVDVLGDNPSASTDSRHFGPVPRRNLIGRVVYRYHPPPRSRWWP